MNELTPRQRRRLQTKQAILDTARQIINQEGVATLSMREIARRIDYSPAALYEYFGGKEEIISAVSAEGHGRLTAALRRVLEDLPPAEKLTAIGLAYIDFAVTYPEHYLLMFTTLPPDNGIEAMMGEISSFPILLGVIEEGIAAGDFRTRPDYGVQEIAYAAWSLVHGISMLRLTYLKDFPLDFAAADRRALDTFARGLTAV